MTTGLNIIFAGTPEFASISLRALLASEHQIIAVYTQPDRPAGRGQNLRMSAVKEVALQANIPIYQPTTFNDDECSRIHELQADVILVSAYGLLLPASVLNATKLGCINIHASLLPKWRGAAPIQRAIIAGDRETGITIMQMVEELDAGPVLYQKKCAIEPMDTGVTLHDRLAKISANEIANVLQQLKNKLLTPVQQNESLVTYAKKLSKQEANIDWLESAVEIERKVRAFNSWPVAYSYLNESRIRIWKAVVRNNAESQHKPGTVLESSNAGIAVATGKGILLITALQLSGGKVINAKDFNNAHNITHQCFYRNDEVVVS